MLIAIPIFGPMFMMVMHFVVLTYAFKNAHATTSTRAFFATLIPTMFWICGACGLLLLNAAVILNALKEGYGH